MEKCVRKIWNEKEKRYKQTHTLPDSILTAQLGSQLWCQAGCCWNRMALPVPYNGDCTIWTFLQQGRSWVSKIRMRIGFPSPLRHLLSALGFPHLCSSLNASFPWGSRQERSNSHTPHHKCSYHVSHWALGLGHLSDLNNLGRKGARQGCWDQHSPPHKHLRQQLMSLANVTIPDTADSLWLSQSWQHRSVWDGVTGGKKYLLWLLQTLPPHHIMVLVHPRHLWWSKLYSQICDSGDLSTFFDSCHMVLQSSWSL